MRCLILCAAKTVVFFYGNRCSRQLLQNSRLLRNTRRTSFLPARLRPFPSCVSGSAGSCCEASACHSNCNLLSDRLLVRDLQLHAGQVPVYRSQLLRELQHLPDVVSKCGIEQSDMSHPTISPVERSSGSRFGFILYAQVWYYYKQ